MRVVYPLAAVVVVLLLSGCAPSASPEMVAAEFYKNLELARQRGFDDVQEELLELLSKSSRSAFEHRAARLNESLEIAPESDSAYRAEDCFVFSHFDGARRELEVSVQAEGPEHVLLKITSGKTSRFLDLLKEEGEWKIDLTATIERNQEEAPLNSQ